MCENQFKQTVPNIQIYAEVDDTCAQIHKINIDVVERLKQSILLRGSHISPVKRYVNFI